MTDVIEGDGPTKQRIDYLPVVLQGNFLDGATAGASGASPNLQPRASLAAGLGAGVAQGVAFNGVRIDAVSDVIEVCPEFFGTVTGGGTVGWEVRAWKFVDGNLATKVADGTVAWTPNYAGLTASAFVFPDALGGTFESFHSLGLTPGAAGTVNQRWRFRVARIGADTYTGQIAVTGLWLRYTAVIECGAIG